MKINIFLLLMLLVNTSFNYKAHRATTNEYDVKEIFEGIDAESGVKVLTDNNELEDINVLLVPVKLEAGNYQVEVTRKTSNLYEVQGTKYYLETRYCYEYAYSQEAILKVESPYGYSRGKLIFD